MLKRLILCATMLAAAVCAQSRQVYTVDPAAITHSLDVNIHGQFLEHIFNSVHGGLWGDMILNGCFVPHSGGGSWDAKDGIVHLTAPATDQRLVFGEPHWTDYELTLEARKDSGGEGFIVMFRTSGDQHYWMNFGGWGGGEHGLEKSRGPMKRVPGKIETGKWYKVRIRCEGARIQAWLDDQPIIDLKDDNPILKGQIGLNTWGSKASFRNIKVTSPDGKVLMDRMPTRSEMVVTPPYWTTYGKDGYLTYDREDSPSGNGSVLIECNGENTHFSLKQGPLNIVEGETYKGRIYMKSADSASVDVKVMRDINDRTPGRLDWTPFLGGRYTNVGPEWNAYDFEFKAPTSNPNAVILLMVNGKGTVKASNLTLFSKTALDNGGFRPDVLKAIKDIKPTTIRYPGGCFASAYRWKDAIGPRDKRKYYPNVIWADQDPNQMGTDEFMLLCEKVGAEPIIAINKAAGVQEALDWLEYCNGPATSKWGKIRAENGHPKPYNVKYWEIDNEVWWMQPEEYAKEVKLFGEALRAKDPSIKIIACGCYAYDTGPGQGDKKDWNKRLLDNAAEYFDYLSIHYYNGILVAQDHINDPRKYEAFMRDDVTALIRNSKNPNIKIYCSEWGQMNDQWRSGLYTAGILNGFERISPLCPMTCPAVWLQTVKGPEGNPRWASCQILFDHRQVVFAPAYVVQKLWRDNFAPNAVKMDGPTEPLNVTATLSADKKILIIKAVNPSTEASDVEVKLAKSAPKSAEMTLIAPGDLSARNTIANPNNIKPVAGKAEIDSRSVTFNMPAMSAAVVKIDLD